MKFESYTGYRLNFDLYVARNYVPKEEDPLYCGVS